MRIKWLVFVGLFVVGCGSDLTKTPTQGPDMSPAPDMEERDAGGAADMAQDGTFQTAYRVSRSRLTLF